MLLPDYRSVAVDITEADITEAEYSQLYCLWIELESWSAELAAQNYPKEESPGLRDIVVQLKETPENRIGDVLRREIQLHEMIWHFSGNAFLRRVLHRVIRPHMESLMLGTKASKYSRRDIISEEERLVEAILARDGRVSRTICRDNLQRMWRDGLLAFRGTAQDTIARY